MGLREELEAELIALEDKNIELLEKRKKIENESRLITEQVRKAKSDAYHGNYSDSTWFRNAEAKATKYSTDIKDINVEVQLLERRMGRVTKKLRTLPDKINLTRERLFIQVAKENISPDLYHRIWSIVDGRIMSGISVESYE